VPLTLTQGHWVNTLTGEGRADALVGASVVIDVSNSPSFEDSAVMRFFETSTRHLLAGRGRSRRRLPRRTVGGGDRAVARERLLSGEGRSGAADREILDSVFDRARDAVFEFVASIADAATDAATVGGTVRLASVFSSPSRAMTSPGRWAGSRSGRR
jgi:hypothetical protein